MADRLMSTLSASEIRNRLRTDKPDRRLVVAPLLDPRKQISDTQAGVDVRLGRIFSTARPWASGVAERVDVADPTPAVSLETFVLEFGQPLIIHPHQFVLARTLELVRLPRDLTAYVIGRSSWGRRGLIVATAVVVHPGFAGPITLELRNLGEMPIAMYPMDRIAQLVFHELTRSEGTVEEDTAAQTPPQAGSQFIGSFEPSLGDVRTEDEKARLVRLSSRFESD